MPVATADSIGTITRPEELVEHFADLIQGSLLPFAYVAKYDENLIPEYPAVLIQPGVFSKEVEGLYSFLYDLRAIIYVLHAKMTVSKQRRSLEDLQLATALVELLEADMTLGQYQDLDTLEYHNRIIFGYVEQELAAALPPRTEKSDAVVGTRLTWRGINKVRFK